ncbi:MAG TPA: DUF3040 domain-containing protein [Pseudonocardiaceae bacterium]|jgi:hypothetical protein
MAAPIPPDEPNKARALSDREKNALADIEDALTIADPDFAARMTRRGLIRIRSGWPRVLDLGALLVFTLLILLMAATHLPPPWWPLLGLISLALVVWVASCARGIGPRRERGDPPERHQP